MFSYVNITPKTKFARFEKMETDNCKEYPNLAPRSVLLVTDYIKYWPLARAQPPDFRESTKMLQFVQVKNSLLLVSSTCQEQIFLVRIQSTLPISNIKNRPEECWKQTCYFWLLLFPATTHPILTAGPMPKTLVILGRFLLLTLTYPPPLTPECRERWID